MATMKAGRGNASSSRLSRQQTPDTASATRAVRRLPHPLGQVAARHAGRRHVRNQPKGPAWTVGIHLGMQLRVDSQQQRHKSSECKSSHMCPEYYSAAC